MYFMTNNHSLSVSHFKICPDPREEPVSFLCARKMVCAILVMITLTSTALTSRKKTSPPASSQMQPLNLFTWQLFSQNWNCGNTYHLIRIWKGNNLRPYLTQPLETSNKSQFPLLYMNNILVFSSDGSLCLFLPKSHYINTIPPLHWLWFTIHSGE